MKPKAVRCAYTWDIPWKGHTAVLRHCHCKNKTLNKTGYCHKHRWMAKEIILDAVFKELE